MNAKRKAIVFLGLGTNVGDKLENLRQAVANLGGLVVIRTTSSVYLTKPWGITDQADFLNMCLSASTDLEPLALLREIKALEIELGRKSRQRWGPRLIDIDILFYNNLIFNSEQLVIPHSQLAERAFVLAPLADIAPELSHPQTGLSVAEMLSAIDVSGVSKIAETIRVTDGIYMG